MKLIEAEYIEKEEEKEIDQTIEIAKIEIAKLLIQQLQNLDQDIQKK